MVAPYSFLPDRQYVAELGRPWKLATFGAGMLGFLYGAVNLRISDWDVGIVLIMGSLTYLFAPWSAYIVLNAARYRPRGWLLHIVAAFAVAMFVVDGVYWAYHTAMGNPMYRSENFVLSLVLYGLAGALWMYRRTFRELVRDTVTWLKPAR